MFGQMRLEPHPVPSWVVMRAGTGGTSATIGRYIRYRHLDTKLCVVDVENSVFYDSVAAGRDDLAIDQGSLIEGIGRPRLEPSFIPTVVDHMLKVPDAASLAAMRVLSARLRRRVGGSSGTNFYGLCWIAARMLAVGESGSLVTLICDSGELYANTYFNDTWTKAHGLDIAPFVDQIDMFLNTGNWAEVRA